MRDEEFKFIVGKLDKLDDRLDAQNETLIRNTVSLETHIKRTDLLEKQIKPLYRAYHRATALIFVGSLLIAAMKLAKDFNLY